MEQIRQHIREMLDVRRALISRGEPEEADAHYENTKLLWARVRAEMKEEITAKQEKLDADLAKTKMKYVTEIMERKEAENKADRKKMMAKCEADFEKMMAKMEADQEESKAVMMACLRKTEARIETGQEQSNTEIETNLEAAEATDLEANPEETEAVVERQEIPNEEAAVHSMRAWRKETVVCQETMVVRLKCNEPTSEDMEPETEHQEKMDAWIADMNDG
jgi:hypothetical protein